MAIEREKQVCIHESNTTNNARQGISVHHDLSNLSLSNIFEPEHSSVAHPGHRCLYYLPTHKRNFYRTGTLPKRDPLHKILVRNHVSHCYTRLGRTSNNDPP